MMFWYYAPPVRLAMQILLGLLALGVSITGGFTTAHNAVFVLLVPAASFGLAWAILRRKHRAVEFRELPPNERTEALELAWRSGFPGPPVVWPFVVGTILPAAATPFVSEEIGFQLARTGGWLGAFVVGAVLSGTYQFFLAAKRQKTDAFREAAVQWCDRWEDKWIEAGIEAAADRARQKFRVEPNVEGHGLLLFRPSAQNDMPPTRCDIQVLLVGPFLAIRRGAYLDVYATSKEQASSADAEKLAKIIIPDDSNNVAESEVHYRDLVSVDYERTANSPGGAEGIFRVSLTSGQRIEFPTSEERTSSAVEAIRVRTRAAKLGTG